MNADPASVGHNKPLAFGLPAEWYHAADIYEQERRKVFAREWQWIGRESQLKSQGDYVAAEIAGYRVFAIRDRDGVLRAFHNVCRHRAAAVVQGRSGHCNQAIRCFYHGWAYELDGRLKALPAEATFANLNKVDFGLKPLESEIYLGFVYVRFQPGGAGVAERFAPYHHELAAYRLDEMIPTGRVWDTELPVDWKNVMDNFLEGYHVPVGHPGLYRLFGTSYEVEARPGDVARAIGWLQAKPSSNWSERHYQRLRPEVAYLPETQRQSWRYYKLLPNFAFDIYPEQMDFFQVIPVAPGKSRLRGTVYGLPGKDRRMKATRWLETRINTKVYEEDNGLIESV